MVSEMAFDVRLGFGRIDLLHQDGSTKMEIPSDLVLMPDVLEALLLIARNGGRRVLERAADDESVIVNVARATISYRIIQP